MVRTSLFISALLITLSAQSQTIEEIEKASEEERRQQRQLDDEQRQQQLEKEIQRPPEYPYPERSEPEKLPDFAGRQCFVINRIIMYGADNLSDLDKHLLTKNVIDTCQTLEQMQQLTQKITDRYLENGYVTTRASLRVPQYLTKDGILEINVIEGRLQEFDSTPDTNKLKRQASVAFPINKREVINISDIDQGISQIGRMSLQKPQVDIQPGDNVGSSRVLFSNPAENSTVASLTQSNDGSPSTGRTPVSLDLETQNPFGINERFFANYSTAYPQKSSANTKSYKLGTDIGVGYWLFYYQYSKSEYTTTIEASNTDIETSGNTETQTAEVTRTLHRSKRNILNFKLGAKTIDKENYIENVLIKVSTRKLANISANLTWQHFYSSGYVSVDFGWSKGIKDLGGIEDRSDLQEYEPRAQDEIITLGINYSQSIWRPAGLNYQMNLQGQHTDDELYSERQFSVGGHSSVRGYRNTGVSEEKGWYARNTLSARPFLLATARKEALDNIKLGLFYDAGKSTSVYGDASYSLLGYGGLVDWSWKILSFSYTRALGLHHPELYAEEQKEEWIDRASLTIKTEF